jgi:hypothetical protein
MQHEREYGFALLYMFGWQLIVSNESVREDFTTNKCFIGDLQ